MGVLISGQWKKEAVIPAAKDGAFKRTETAFRRWIKQDGSTDFSAEANRYHLYVSYACPWAARTLLMRSLKGLESIISMSAVEPLLSEEGWSFSRAESPFKDSLYQSAYLRELYVKAASDYTGRVTVPVLWDKKKETIVSNESAEILRMMNAEFAEYSTNNYDYYPTNLQPAIDKINDFVYERINNGVYQCGFASTQTAYEEAYEALFSALDMLNERFSQQDYLIKDVLTEADLRLFTTLVRFDAVYYFLFKCNKRPIASYAHLARYLKQLLDKPAIKATVDLPHIKTHYYLSLTQLNPRGIVPKGPEPW